MAKFLSQFGSKKRLAAVLALIMIAIVVSVLTSAIDVLSDDETLTELSKGS